MSETRRNSKRGTVKAPRYLGRFCFTYNNYEESEYENIKGYIKLYAKFGVVGREIGEKGTPHLQGFINLIERDTFYRVRGHLYDAAHIEVAKGTDQQNLEYCTKQDKNAFVFGTPCAMGARNDLKSVAKKVLEGVPMKEIAKESPDVFVQHYRGLQQLRSTIQEPRTVDDPPTVLWLWGKAGTGKTRLAFDQMPHEQIYIKDGTQWWDNYTNQQCVVIDDFDGHWPYRDLLRLLDRYPYQGQFKGGYVTVNSPIIIITCEHPPEMFWSGNELAQVTRRITMTQCMNP